MLYHTGDGGVILMALRFISHKEIAFRQLLGMLRAPPVAVMSYYSNVFMSAKFVMGDQPEKLRFLDKEIRRIECMVGVVITPESGLIQDKLQQLFGERYQLEEDLRRIESMFDSAKEDQQQELMKTYQEVQDRIKVINGKEHFLLFKLQPMMDLKQMETYMDNNLDLKSFFKENGKLITQLEINSELDKLKNWVYNEAVQLMPYVRFTKLE
jgi:hypothetical protein